ncbi:short-chain dehydrogenase [Sphingobium lactosutens]|uniref:SDR family oxidoreductase n=1 Tax=Sphingobium lactosutens TaxID=522773 RepID=UPI0035617425|nr:short-chain dehydrogenase [Sphingobium lactosutens]
MDLGIRHKTAFVMGGSKGIGQAVARELARAGCNVAIAARNDADLDAEVKALREIGAQAIGIRADLSDPRAFEPVFETMRASLGPADIAIFSPPQPPTGSFIDLEPELFEKALSEVVLAFIHMVRLVYPHMREKSWGRIVTIGSMVTKQPARGGLGFDYALANISRSAAASASKTISAELAPFGITVNTVAPGSIDTISSRTFREELADSSGARQEQLLEMLMASTPARRIGQPSEVAGLVAYLCSVQAGFTTGETILCDGGLANCIV